MCYRSQNTESAIQNRHYGIEAGLASHGPLYRSSFLRAFKFRNPRVLYGQLERAILELQPTMANVYTSSVELKLSNCPQLPVDLERTALLEYSQTTILHAKTSLCQRLDSSDA